MNVDDAGHRFGYDSPQYRNAARTIDGLLSLEIPQWLAHGYQVLVTSDHGMNNDRSHGGVLPEERQVPLFTIGSRFAHTQANTKINPNIDTLDVTIRQTEICGLVADLLGLQHSYPLRSAHSIVLQTV
jgi:predicted AlkP superfamily pyrophosphatase or phosphodiesterase